ncbi:MAG: DUF1349 domain-containing protein [Demequina sp.]|uniref:DUF1349 domain-containing protein n=1 Tax=Demequina sp. TaxID=2050685 RepID=UPI003A8496F1
MTHAMAGLPALQWTGDEAVALVDDDHTALTLVAAAGVDWTNDAGGGPQQHAASALAFAAPEGDFVLQARVTVEGPRTTFDAGALVLWADRDHWAKLCFEYSPQGDAMVVSVVTDAFSDDSNGPVVTDASVFLRLARVGDAVAFHFSLDGERWDFVRVFRLPSSSAPWQVGFLSQAPMGDACTAVFDQVEYAERTLEDLRDGS